MKELTEQEREVYKSKIHQQISLYESTLKECRGKKGEPCNLCDNAKANLKFWNCFLSLLSKDQARQTKCVCINQESSWNEDIGRYLCDECNLPSNPKDRPMTKEEMNQAIEEAKNEDSSPEITSAFEPVVGAEEAEKTMLDTLNAIDSNFIFHEKRYLYDQILMAMQLHASAVASKMAREKVREYKNPYDQKKQYIEWAAVENALDDLLRNELKNKLKSEQMKDNHEELRKLTAFQHWLGTNYSNLPTDSGNMTKRARLYYKELKNKLK